jgi:DNA-binding NtrC family response regulator
MALRENPQRAAAAPARVWLFRWPLRPRGHGTSVALPAGIMMHKEHVQPPTTSPSTPQPIGGNAVAPISLDDRLRELEASLISWALAASRGNKSKAARLLQVKRSTLGDRINRCGLGRQPEAAPAAGPRPVPDRGSELVGR